MYVIWLCRAMVRVLNGEEHNGELSRSAIALATTYDQWDDDTKHQIFMTCSSDPLGYYSLHHLHQRVSALFLTMMPRAPHLRVPRRGAGTKCWPPPMRGQRKPRMHRCQLHHRAREKWTIYRHMTNGRLQGLAKVTLQQAGNGEPSLPPPRPAGPCLELCCEPPSPPAEEMTPRQCRVVRWHAHVPGERPAHAEELTALAPFTMKIIVVAPPE